MRTSPKTVAAVCLLTLAPVLTAQTAIFAEADGKLQLVRRVDGTMPQVEAAGGKLIPASNKILMRQVPRFAPVTVKVSSIAATGRYVDLRGQDMEADRKFEFKAVLESPTELRDVFIALDFRTDRSGRILHIQEVGTLPAGQPVPIRALAYVGEELENDRYVLHVYSEGAEVMNTALKPEQIEAGFDEFVQTQISGVTSAPPKQYSGPTPEYPPSLKEARVSGKAVVRITIGADGRVSNAQLKSATDPLFGESALAAAKQWRFIPRVKEGKPAAITVDMPFNFDAPTDGPVELKAE